MTSFSPGSMILTPSSGDASNTPPSEPSRTIEPQKVSMKLWVSLEPSRRAPKPVPFHDWVLFGLHRVPIGIENLVALHDPGQR